MKIPKWLHNDIRYQTIGGFLFHRSKICRDIKSWWFNKKFKAWLKFAERHHLFVKITPKYLKERLD